MPLAKPRTLKLPATERHVEVQSQNALESTELGSGSGSLKPYRTYLRAQSPDLVLACEVIGGVGGVADIRRHVAFLLRLQIKIASVTNWQGAPLGQRGVLLHLHHPKNESE